MSEVRKPRNELAPQKPAGLPAASDFDDEAPVGLENARQEELKPSFLYLLATNSKVVNRGAAEYINGAQPGMFYSSGSGRVYEKVEFVPVHRRMTFLEWVPIDDGGGFRGEHDPDSDFVKRLRTPENRFSKIDTGNGTELVQTFELYALIGEPGFDLGSAELVNIPFTSIKIRHYSAWFDTARKLRYLNSQQQWVTPPIFAHRWLLTSEFEPKWKPNGAWNCRIALAAPTKEQAFLRAADPLRQEALKLYNMIEAGAVKSDYAAERQPGDDGDDDPPPM